MVKIILIVAALLAIGSAVLGYMNMSAIDVTKQALADKQTEVENKETEISELASELEAKQAALEEAQTLSANAEQEIASVKREVSTAKQSVSKLESMLTDKNTEIENLKGELASVKEESQQTVPDQQVVEQASQTSETINQMKQQLEAAEMEAKLTAEKLEAARSRVKTLEQESARREGAIMAKGLQGQILAVNPAWNFVVLSLGDRQGVSPNAEMLVRRGGKMIGRIRITSVEKSNSIADVVSGSVPSGIKIRPGDTVIYSGASSGS